MKKIHTLCTTILAGVTLSASGAVMFDNSLDGDQDFDGTNSSFDLGSLTVGDNDDTFLAFGAAIGENDLPLITGVTFDGVDLTSGPRGVRGGNNYIADIWYLDAEVGNATGNLVVTFDSVGASNDSFYFSLASFYNVGGLAASDSGNGGTSGTLSYGLGVDPIDVGYFEVGSSNDAAPTGVIGSTTLVTGSTGSYGGAIFRASQNGASGTVNRTFATGDNASAYAGIAITAIPETSTYFSIAGVLMLGLVAVRRRRRA